ncbi:MAG: AMP-binding protein, partial [Thermodesulfobacteriota bacterium]
NAIHYRDFQAPENGLKIQFEQLPFEHPLYIMFTSGTTGLPKCMVQSAGGILIHHLKELILHTNLKREDTIFYFTTCGWMMWNWLVSSLGVGAKLLLYDGNPFHPDPGVLWRTAQQEGITVFGTSAGYIAALMNEGLRPGKEYDLSALKTILSTGSPLSEDGFEFVYREVRFASTARADRGPIPYRTLAESAPAVRLSPPPSPAEAAPLRLGCFLPLDDAGQAAVRGMQ